MIRYKKTIFIISFATVLLLLAGCVRESNIIYEPTDIPTSTATEKHIISEDETSTELQIVSTTNVHKEQDMKGVDTSSKEDKISKIESLNIEEIIYNDYEIITELIVEEIGEECRITMDTSVRLGKKFELRDNNVVVEVGYTLNNNYYFAEIKGTVFGDNIDWEFIQSNLILEDVDQYIEIATNGFFEVFLTERLGDNVIEQKVVSSYFEGVYESGYMISLDYKFKVKDGFEVQCAGSVGASDEIGWYQGWHFIKMERIGDSYQVLNYATSP